MRFAALCTAVEPGLRRALVAAYGPDLGSDAAADALAWAWEHFERVEAMDNPAGYLWRVGQTSVRRAAGGEHARQRAAVLLVHGYGYPPAEAAGLLGCRVRTLRNHLDRGLTSDVEDSLRSLATDLETRSRPTTPAAAMARTAPVRRPRPRSARVAAGVLAATVLVVVATGAGLIRGDGGDHVETDQSPSSTPAPTGGLRPPATGAVPGSGSRLPEVLFAGVPTAGFADVTTDGVVLLSLDGTELGTGTAWPGGVPTRGRDLVVLDDQGITTVEQAPPDPAPIPEGCDAAAGAGGTRLALCDEGHEVVRIEPSGAQARVATAPAGYTWSRALPSPDGRWMLTEATDDCGSTVAAFGSTDGSGELTTLVGDAMVEGHAVGWLPDGRAVTQLVGGGCGQADIPSRVFVTEPGGDDAQLPIEPQGVLYMWARADVRVTS